jgi:micrococcal nuclease
MTELYAFGFFIGSVCVLHFCDMESILALPRETVLSVLATIMIAYGGEYGPYMVMKKGDVDARRDFVYMQTVVDGDTFILESGETVRLAEVNAPEVGECGAKEATTMLGKVLAGKPLRLVKDEVGQDSFGRLTRIVVIDSENARARNVIAQEYLAERGLVRYSPHGNRAYQEGIKSAEARAKERLLGIWKACKKENAVREEKEKSPTADAHTPPTDPTCVIKGNVSDNGYGKQYFLPTCRSYDQIKITPDRGEGYYCSEAEAKKAGFMKSGNCGARGALPVYEKGR